MFKREFIGFYLKTGIVASILYTIPMIMFLNSASFSSTYLLFIGNMLFAFAVAILLYIYNNSRGGNASTQNMKAVGHIASITGVIIATIIAAIALVIIVPDILSSGKSETAFENAPSQTGTGKTNGLVFVLLMNTIIGNFTGGSLAALIVPITAKKDQTKDRNSEVLNN